MIPAYQSWLACDEQLLDEEAWETRQYGHDTALKRQWNGELVVSVYSDTRL